MRNSFKESSKINGVAYKIENVVGRGSTCVVYNATRTVKGQKQYCLVKEFWPEGCDKADENDEQFRGELARFAGSINTMIGIYNDIDPNNTPFIDSASCNNYVVMQRLYGTTFEDYKPASLYELFLRVRAITQIIKKYHDHGLLHLDIKPANIFCCDEDPNRVQIVDYDSIVWDSNLSGKPECALDIRDENVDVRFSSSWAAAELQLGLRDEIGRPTDLFAIGELLYYKLFGEHSDLLDRNTHAHFDLYSPALLKGTAPVLYDRLTDFFHKTLSSNPDLRYQTADELLEALNNMLEYTQTPYIISNLEGEREFFIGRDAELDKAAKMLGGKRGSYLFVQGDPGIGKSALVVAYAHKHLADYDAVYHTNSDDPIEEIELGNYNKGNQEYDRTQKFEAIYKACECSKKGVLLLIGDAEKIDEKIIEKLITLPNCDKIFLTRNADSIKKERLYLPLNELSEADALNVFQHYCKVSEEELPDVRKIVTKQLGCHTYAVKLAAGMIASGIYTVENFARETENSRFGNAIEMLFGMSVIDQNELSLLACMALLPRMGIRKRLLNDWTNYEQKINVLYLINKLINIGWIMESDYSSSSMVSLHPLVEELVLKKLREDPELCRSLLNWLISCCLSRLKGFNEDDKDNICYSISCVAYKLMQKDTFSDDKFEQIRSDVAELLVKSCDVSGSFITRIERIERAIMLYLPHDGKCDCQKAMEASRYLRVWYIRHWYDLYVNDGFSKVLSRMLEVFPPCAESQNEFETMFKLILRKYRLECDNKKVKEWFGKLEEYCSVLDNIGGRERAKLLLKESVMNINVKTYDPKNFKGKTSEEKFEEAKSEPIAAERAALLLAAASASVQVGDTYGEWCNIDGEELYTFSTFNLQPQTALKCFEEIKEALGYEYGVDQRIIDLVNRGIDLLKEATTSGGSLDEAIGVIEELKGFNEFISSAPVNIGFC